MLQRTLSNFVILSLRGTIPGRFTSSINQDKEGPHTGMPESDAEGGAFQDNKLNGKDGPGGKSVNSSQGRPNYYRSLFPQDLEEEMEVGCLGPFGAALENWRKGIKFR
jgi:hypothetical protein